MNATETEPAYAIGEEVVVRLEGITALDAASSTEIDAHELPPWTIATITARLHHGDSDRYAIRFRHHHTTLIATLQGTAIDGTA